MRRHRAETATAKVSSLNKLSQAVVSVARELNEPVPEILMVSRGKFIPLGTIHKLGPPALRANQRFIDAVDEEALRMAVKHEFRHVRERDWRSSYALKLMKLPAQALTYVMAVNLLTTGALGLFALPLALSLGAMVLTRQSLKIFNADLRRRHERAANRFAIKTPADAAALRRLHFVSHALQQETGTGNLPATTRDSQRQSPIDALRERCKSGLVRVVGWSRTDKILTRAREVHQDITFAHLYPAESLAPFRDQGLLRTSNPLEDLDTQAFLEHISKHQVEGAISTLGWARADRLQVPPIEVSLSER